MLVSGVAAIVPLMDLPNPAKASTRPTEQRAKLVTILRLKNAALVDFVFMVVTFFLF